MQERKKKLGMKQQNHFQTSGTESLLNLIKVRITIKGNGLMNKNMKKGSITMNVTMMVLI